MSDLAKRYYVQTKTLVAAASLTAAFLLLCATQAFAGSCTGGSVDGFTTGTPMCFGSMVPQLSPFHYSDQAAADLAATMENPTPDPPGTDRGTADDNPTLPSEYTYLGQFIDHNLDFDETPQPTANVSPSSLTNFESFRFDLNNVFGGGPTVDPQLYAADQKHLLVSGTLGTPQSDGFPTVTGNNGIFDLARNPSTGAAILVEPRDDETQILSQISAAFVAFYNNFINRGFSYAQARQLTEDYYQEMVLTDVRRRAAGGGRAAARDPAHRLIVDVGGLRFADSSAIALWVRWAGTVSQLSSAISAAPAEGDHGDGTRPEVRDDTMRRTRAFPADRQSVTAARRFATEVLVGTPSDLLESVELMVSELATNCVRHVKTTFELMILRTAQEIRVEVTDHGGGIPAMRSPGPEDPSGRGLRIVDMLSERWGVAHRSIPGKTVWFTLPAIRETEEDESRAQSQLAERRESDAVACTGAPLGESRANLRRVRCVPRPRSVPVTA
jgi:anti-sigma regulatory factor (Ser/Thr protein kinase)